MLDFFKTAANLKRIPRQGWIDKLSLNNPESVADHSYSMAVMSMVISDLGNYDSEKILKMVLLHDLSVHPCRGILLRFAAVLKKSNISNHKICISLMTFHIIHI